ncbi:MAG: hypothetical protein ABJF10_08170 [Chthoniobacter sp.]|uniref:hypothetical protein n=1 Tax=Chthoniobacter sp. TaxID=2510640 RepID=UPI0032A6EE96
MKAPLLILLLLLQLLSPGMAVTVPLPDVPPPALSVERALAIAEKTLGRNPSEIMLVGVDWCPPSKFQPRYTTGGSYPDLEKKSGEYCWFITFLDKKADPTQPADHQKFREITLIRIQNDGTAHILPFGRD